MAFSTPNCINYKYDNTVLHSLTCKDGDNLFTTQTPRDITFESYFVAGIGCVIIFLTKKFEAAVDLSDSGDLRRPISRQKSVAKQNGGNCFFWRENLKQVFK